MLQIGMSDRSPARPEVDHQPSAHRHSLRGEGACFGLSRRSVDGRCLSSQSGVSPMIKSIPLAKLVQSPRKVHRHGDPAADSELKASIAAHGLLQNLIVRPAARGKFEVEAGERRRCALLALAEEKVLPKGYEVTCLVLEDDAEIAVETSLAENFHRLAMKERKSVVQGKSV